MRFGIASIKRALGLETVEVLEPSIVQRIWSDPGSYNRETRRRAGVRWPVGLLPRGVEAPQVRSMPRYARRHVEALMAPSTRRNRRHRARIVRVMAPLQLDMTPGRDW